MFAHCCLFSILSRNTYWPLTTIKSLIKSNKLSSNSVHTEVQGHNVVQKLHSGSLGMIVREPRYSMEFSFVMLEIVLLISLRAGAVTSSVDVDGLTEHRPWTGRRNICRGLCAERAVQAVAGLYCNGVTVLYWSDRTAHSAQDPNKSFSCSLLSGVTLHAT